VTTLTFRRPTVLPIHRASWVRPAGSIDFRVTQTFASLDGFYAGKPHNAVDLGNFRCGDAVVAMLAGTCRRVKDNATALGAATDALGLVIDHGYGVTSEYWHLQSYIVADGAKVTAGQGVAIVGRTGLGNVCHLHTEVKLNGVRIDPEPLMFGGSLSIGGDDVKLPGKFLRHVQNRSGTLTSGSNFRAGVIAGEDASLGVLAVGTLLYPIVVVAGRPVGTAADAAEWYGALAYVGSAYQLGFVHSSVLPRTAAGVALTPIDSADCSSQEAELAQIRTKLARAATSAAGASQAVTATVEALR